jgi:four helix bundle protein
MKSCRDLQVWGKVHKLALAIDRDTRDFPTEERFVWTSQIRRSTTATAAYLAEGCGRRSDGEMARFIQISMGSGAESFLSSITSEGPGFLEEHGIFQAKLRFRGSHENATCRCHKRSEMPWRLRGFRLKAKGRGLKASNPKLVATTAFMLASKPVIAIRGHIV